MAQGFDTIEVRLADCTYPIMIGTGMGGHLCTALQARCRARRASVITDDRVAPLHADGLLAALSAAGIAADLLSVPAGESSKTLHMCAELYDALAELQHKRDEPVIALGGGVIGDLAGFVAATWHRGVPFVQCPTTLEADIDAAIGGKTGVNHASGKNLIGSFHQPLLVCIDLACLESLPQRDYIAGLAESVKHGVSLDPAFLAWHEQNAAAISAREPAALRHLVRRNCEIKAGVVMADEREQALGGGVGRAALNFGHTVGHALESHSGFGLRHGEAVSLGMVAAMDMAVRRLGLAEAQRVRVERLLSGLGLPIRLQVALDADELLARMSSDKKNIGADGGVGGVVRFVLTPRLGELQWYTPERADIAAALARLSDSPE